jgi:hypothetical protein
MPPADISITFHYFAAASYAHAFEAITRFRRLFRHSHIADDAAAFSPPLPLMLSDY